MASFHLPAYQTALQTIQQSQLPHGGFASQPENQPRTDSTAWAVLALSAFDISDDICDRGRGYLQTQQHKNGSLSFSSNHPETSWPTPIAILAWHGVKQFQTAQQRAVEFLLDFTGAHFEKSSHSAIGHDPSIRGWPWVAHTHSWVLPTALAMTTLQIAGFPQHQRIDEGKHMLLDRQLPHGGWNSGNTITFGKELHPLPECTGIALQALASNTPMNQVEKSLDYVLGQWPSLQTPISLGWALLGLGAWGLRPANAEEKVLTSLDLQARYGPYSLPSLSLLLCAAQASHGLHSLFGHRSLSRQHSSSQ